MRKVLLFLLVSCPVLLNSQRFNSTEFEERVKMAGTLLVLQPTGKQVKESLPPGFTLDYTEEFKYHIKDPQRNSVTAYLHITTLKVVYVEFSEPKATFVEIQKFLTDVKKFEWVGSEHLWNYFNDKKFAIAISPEMTVHVSLYDL
jgi:hypothetical protein